MVRLLLAAGPDLEAVAADGNTALLRAVKNRSPGLVRQLVDRGAKAATTLPAAASFLTFSFLVMFLASLRRVREGFC